MTVPHATLAFDINDAKLWPLVADAPGAASPTYGNVIDIFGINTIGIDPNLVTQELLGDSAVIAKKGKVDRINISGTYAKLDLDMQAAMIGGTVSDVTGPPVEARWDYQAGVPLPYFALGFEMNDVSTDAGIRDLWVVLYKCQITGGSMLNPGAQKFSQPTFTAEAFAPQSNFTRTMRVRILDTQVALSQGAIAA